MRILSLAFLSLSICALTVTGCTNAAGVDESDGDVAPTGEAQQALSGVIASYPGTTWPSTNSKKIVRAAGAFHAVYEYAASVFYGSSTDGITWSAPTLIDSANCGFPSIAVANDGTVEVVYLRNLSSGHGNVYSARKPSNSQVFTTVGILTASSEDNSATAPSIVADGNQLHVAWGWGGYVKYTTFPSSQSSTPTAETVHAAVNQNVVYQPAIAAGPGPNGNRIVRVSFYNDVRDFDLLELRTIERNGNWFPVDVRTQSYTTGFVVASVSVDLNPATGDFYVAHARVIDSTASTYLLHENTIVANDSFASFTLDPTAARLISVAARNEPCSRFRILSNAQFSSFGALSYRTGAWTSGATPTWIDPAPVNLPLTPRAGTALMVAVPIPNTNTARYFVGAYEDTNGPNNYRLLSSYFTAAVMDPCN